MKYKIVVDKQSRTNPSDEKREYEIDIEELRVKGNIYDSLVITDKEDYVIRRLALTNFHVLVELAEPIRESIPDLNIKLFEGENYIYLVDMEGNNFFAEYLIKNDFTDTFVMKSEMNSAISQTAREIEISVNKKLTEYVTEGQLDNKVTELNSTIDTKAGEINLEVSKKVNDSDLTGGNIILRINNDESEAVINAEKVNIQGFVTFSDLSTPGQTTINGANITSGTITGRTISGGELIGTTITNGNGFEVSPDGSMTATLGIIGGFTLGSTSFSSSFNGLYDYDDMDINLIINTVLQTIKLNSSIQNILDVDNDGEVTVLDANEIIEKKLNRPSAVDNKYISGTLQINTQNPKRCLTITTGGYTTVSMGAGGIFSSCIQTENLICGYSNNDANFSGIILDWRKYKQTFMWNNVTIGSLYVTSDSFFNIQADQGLHLRVGLNDAIGIGGAVEIYKTINMHGNEIINAGNVSSDKRLKKDIKNTEINAIDRIKQIQHHSFAWKKDNKQEDIGYIAQELEEIDPNYVRHNIEKDKEGNITSDMYEVRILPILSTATKAIQEQQKIIEQQQEEINELKLRIEKLEGKYGTN